MLKSGASVAFLVALVVLAGCAGEPSGPLRVGATSPGFELPALEGGKVSSAAYAGKPVVLNFWATWCLPCRKEFPVLQELAADPGVEVLAIALDEAGERVVRPFVEREGFNYTVLLGDESVFQRFSGFSIPYTLLLDERQTVISIYRGPATLEDLRRDLSARRGA